MRKNFPVTQRELPVGAQANILSTTNLKGQITYINKDFIDISGFTESELIGQNHHIIRHPDMPPPVFKMFWQDLQAEKSWMGIVKNRCKNGDHYWVDAYATPIKKDGRVEEYQSVRRKARPEYIERAEKVYASISNGKPLAQTKNKMPMMTQLMLMVIAPFLLVPLAWIAGLNALSLMFTALLSTALSACGAAMTFRPMQKAIERAKSLTSDTVARYIYTAEGNDAGSILLALKKLESENAALIGRIHDMSRVLTDNAETLSSAVEQSRVGTLAQFEQAERVASAVEEMTASIEQVAENSGDTSKTTDKSLSLAQSGKTNVDKTAEAIRKLKAQIQTTSSTVSEVSNRSTDIEKILDVITAIAEQTNLLALNAAIEAARAGESGRGFAVVADEVRSLASRTQQSTSEIRAVIDALQAEVGTAVKSMQHGQAMAEESVALSAQTEQSLADILTAFEKIAVMGGQIAEATQEQSSVAAEIGDNITRIRDNAQQNIEGVEKSGEVASKTQRVTSRLDQLTQQFWEQQAE
ncbi:methyl-accepting chemotaxis protein [Aliidiomarina sp. Khilg15.8]